MPSLPAPMAAAVGVSIAPGSTDMNVGSVTLVGSLNTYGHAGSWWFTFGTTPDMGAVTPSAAASASAAPSASVLPATVQTAISGLALGTEYWFATVVKTPSGTTVSTPIPFLVAPANQPLDVGDVATQGLVSDINIPHFSWPFTLVHGTGHMSANGRVASNDGAVLAQQDSDGEITTCVTAIVSCVIGEFPQVPAFGIPDYTFSQAPVDVNGLATTILRWENRATETAITSMIPDGTTGSWSIEVEVGA